MSLQPEITQDLAACHALRRAVFIEEQGIAEVDEWDDLDGVCDQVLIRDNTHPVATARLHQVGRVGKIGRICVDKAYRGKGLGAALVAFGMAHYSDRPDVDSVMLSAQAHLRPFYEKLGFEARGDLYDDAGIPHLDMVHTL